VRWWAVASCSVHHIDFGARTNANTAFTCTDTCAGAEELDAAAAAYGLFGGAWGSKFYWRGCGKR
jgi:hypothetical protein